MIALPLWSLFGSMGWSRFWYWHIRVTNGHFGLILTTEHISIARDDKRFVPLATSGEALCCHCNWKQLSIFRWPGVSKLRHFATNRFGLSMILNYTCFILHTLTRFMIKLFWWCPFLNLLALDFLASARGDYFWFAVWLTALSFASQTHSTNGTKPCPIQLCCLHIAVPERTGTVAYCAECWITWNAGVFVAPLAECVVEVGTWWPPEPSTCLCSADLDSGGRGRMGHLFGPGCHLPILDHFVLR